VFFQIAPQPLITVTREHFIGQAIELCGGQNVYAAVPGLTLVVSVESVVAEAPAPDSPMGFLLAEIERTVEGFEALAARDQAP
jgi:hypothetical protein